MRRNSLSRKVFYSVVTICAFVLLWKQFNSEKDVIVPSAFDSSAAPARAGGENRAKNEVEEIIDTTEKQDDTQRVTGDNDSYDVKKEYELLIQDRPVVIFSKSYCPYSMKAKEILLEDYVLEPAPMVIELDLHQYGRELQDHLRFVTGRRTVPNVFIGAESRGGGDDIVKLNKDGNLIKTLEEWGKGLLRVQKRA